MEEYKDSLALTFADPHGIINQLVRWDEGTVEFKEALKSSMFGSKSDTSGWTKAGDALGSGIKKVGAWALDKFEELLSSALDEIDNLLKYSLMTDSSVRDTKFTYGFSSAQAYGFDKALNMLGISEDDLMYMNPQQSQKFREAFTKYTEKYNQLADSGFFEKQLEYQIEMNEFKEDMKLEVVGFLMDNKELIKTVLETSLKFMETTVKSFGWVVDILSNVFTVNDSIGRADAGSILNNYSTRTTVNQTNNFNGVGSADKSWLANAGQMTYEQIIQTLNQGV